MTDTKFRQGQSGNPKGRRPGTGEVAVLRKSIAAHLPAIVRQLVKDAKEGDSRAARLLLERVIPPIKAMEQSVEFVLPADQGLTAQGAAIIQEVAAGKLSPSQGAALLSGLGNLARVKELDELTNRIEELELQQEKRQ